MNKLAWRGYLVAVHASLALAVFHSDLADRVQQRMGWSSPPSPWPLMLSIHRQMDDQVPAGATIFLGDSITQALATSAVAAVSVNYGISGQRSDQLLESMDTYRSMARAAAVVVTIGTNDVRAGQADGLQARYAAILRKIPPGVPVVLSGIPPLAEHDVRPAVAAARSACDSDPRCTFLDASGPLAGMLADDGVHLSSKGYAAWIELLRASLTGLGGRSFTASR